MAQDRINTIIDRKAVAKEIKDTSKEVRDFIALIQKVKATSVSVTQAKSMQDYSKLRKELEALIGKTNESAESAIKEAKARQEQAKAAQAEAKASQELTKQKILEEKAKQESVKTTDKETASKNKSVKMTTEEKLAAQQSLKIQKERIQLRNADEGSLRKTELQFQKLTRIIYGFTQAQRDSVRGQSLIKFADQLNSKLKETDYKFGSFKRNVGNYANSFASVFEKATQELAKLQAKQQSLQGNQARDPIGFKVRGGEDDLNKTSAGVKELTNFINSLGQASGSATQGVRKLEQAYIGFVTSGQQSKDFLNDFKNEIGAAKDEVRDLKESINLAASDTRQLDVLIGAAQAVAGGFAVAQGAAALFGDESEDIQKTLVKLNAAMSILNGLQAIQNELKKKDNIVTGIQIGLQKVYAFVVGTSTGALKAFRIALATTGVGLLILGIGLLISKLGLLGDAANDAAKDIEELSLAIEDLNFKSSRELKDLQNANNIIISQLKARGASEKEISAAKIKGLKAEKDLIDKNLQSGIAELNYSGILNTQLKDRKDIEAAINNERDRQLFQFEDAKESGKELSELDKKQIQRSNQRIEQLNKLLDLSDQSKQKEVEIIEEGLDEEAKAREKSVEAAKKASEKKKEIAERERQAIFELGKLDLESQIRGYEKIANDEEESDDRRIQATEILVQKKKELAELAYNFEKNTADKTAKELELAEKQKQEAIAEAAQDGADKITEIGKAAAEKLKAQIEESKQSTLNKLIGGFEVDKAKLDSENKKALEALSKRYALGLVAEEDYAESKEEINIQYQLKQLQAEIDFAKKIIDIKKQYGFDTTEDEKNIALLQIQLDNAVTENHIRNNEKKKKSDEERFQDLAKQIQTIGDLSKNITQAVTEIVSIGFDNAKDAIDAQIEDLEKRKEKDIEVATTSIQNEKERAAVIFNITELERNKREQLERRKRQIAVEQAKFERVQNIGDIIQRTALAVVTTLGDKTIQPGFLRIPLAISIGALGLAQLVRAVAAPIPRFATGGEVKEDGVIMVGDAGKHEKVNFSDGTSIKTPKIPTLMYAKKGTKIEPDYDKAMTKAAVGVVPMFREVVQMDRSTPEIVSELREIKGAIEGIPQSEIQVENLISRKIRNGMGGENKILRA